MKLWELSVSRLQEHNSYYNYKMLVNEKLENEI